MLACPRFRWYAEPAAFARGGIAEATAPLWGIIRGHFRLHVSLILEKQADDNSTYPLGSPPVID